MDVPAVLAPTGGRSLPADQPDPVPGQIAALQAELSELRHAHEALQRRLTRLLDLGQEQKLLDRLDLFYLLLVQRIDRALGPAAPPATPGTAPAVMGFGPADIEGIGIFDVETDGVVQWRWFGPDATIALRGAARGARRVVMYFHTFGETAELPVIRVTVGGPPETIIPRWLETRFAIDITLYRGTPWPDDLLILHLTFDRYRTTEADPRPLAAVFSNAEVIFEPS